MNLLCFRSSVKNASVLAIKYDLTAFKQDGLEVALRQSNLARKRDRLVASAKDRDHSAKSDEEDVQTLDGDRYADLGVPVARTDDSLASDSQTNNAANERQRKRKQCDNSGEDGDVDKMPFKPTLYGRAEYLDYRSAVSTLKEIDLAAQGEPDKNGALADYLRFRAGEDREFQQVATVQNKKRKGKKSNKKR